MLSFGKNFFTSIPRRNSGASQPTTDPLLFGYNEYNNIFVIKIRVHYIICNKHIKISHDKILMYKHNFRFASFPFIDTGDAPNQAILISYEDSKTK